MSYFFTADWHWGHSNIIKYCNRPFKDAQEMNEALLENYCNVVKPGDHVYHLGDVAFQHSPEDIEIFKKLPGKKFLILGNHDKRLRKDFKNWGFHWAKDVYELNIKGGMRKGGFTIWLSHYAHLTWNKRHHGSWHCYGHSHGGLPKRPQMADVGVDCWNFKPVSLEELSNYIQSV